MHVSIRSILSELNASDAESRQQTHSDEHSALALLATHCTKATGATRRRTAHYTPITNIPELSVITPAHDGVARRSGGSSRGTWERWSATQRCILFSTVVISGACDGSAGWSQETSTRAVLGGSERLHAIPCQIYGMLESEAKASSLGMRKRLRSRLQSRNTWNWPLPGLSQPVLEDRGAKAHGPRNTCSAWCRHTQERFECTHGGVLDGHTGFSAATPHHTHIPQPQPQRHTPQTTPQTPHALLHTTSHGDRDIERQ